MQSVFIKGRFPGLNEIIKTARGNKFASAAQKKAHTERVYYSCLHLNPVKSADFIFTWYEKNKRRDKDNIAAGGTKYCLDGLVIAKVIPNDGWKEIRSITHKFEVGEPGVLIEITEV